jgi:hypothetical protein
MDEALSTYHTREEEDSYLVVERTPQDDGGIEEETIARVPKDAEDELFEAIGTGSDVGRLKVQIGSETVVEELPFGEGFLIGAGPVKIEYRPHHDKKHD